MFIQKIQILKTLAQARSEIQLSCIILTISVTNRYQPGIKAVLYLTR